MPTPFTPLHKTMFETPRPLLAGEVHIWCLNINQFSAAHVADAAQIMNPSERERAQKFVRGKESYIASRWLLRKALARYTGDTPEAIEFLRSDKGKPYLSQHDIRFSLSHSGHWVLLAVSNIELFGIDVEVAANSRDLQSIAESYFHPQEYAQLQKLSGTNQCEYFYRLWTLKEAFFKATGTGISAGLENIAFDLTGNTISVQIAAALNENGDDWQFYQWLLDPRIYCALAYKSDVLLTATWFDAFSAPAFP